MALPFKKHYNWALLNTNKYTVTTVYSPLQILHIPRIMGTRLGMTAKYNNVWLCAVCLFCCRALKKLNEKKQVFNMYKTQKAKEEKVSHLCHQYCPLPHHTHLKLRHCIHTMNALRNTCTCTFVCSACIGV